MTLSNRKAHLLGPNDGHWLGWLGHSIRYLATGTETDDAYCLSSAAVATGLGAPPHSHDFDEAFYVLDGKVEFTAGNRKVVLSAGELVHITGGTAHHPKALIDSTLLTLAVPAGFDTFQARAGEVLPSRTAPISKSRNDVLADVQRIASDFGIDMNPPADAFQTTPTVHVATLNDGDVIDAVGDRYRFLIEGDQTNGQYALWHAVISPGGGPPLHTHNREDEAFYVLSGELTFEADGGTFVGMPGSFVNLPIGSRHKFTNATDVESEVLILVAPAGLETMFRQTGQRITDSSQPIAPPNETEFKRLSEIAPNYGIELHLQSRQNI